MIKYLIFDLDGTLYDETDYVNACYSEIAESIDKRKCCDIVRFMMNERRMNGDSKVFQAVLEKYNLEKYYLERFLHIYHTCNAKLSLFDDVRFFLDDNNKSKHYETAILSNGGKLTQENKCRLLGVNQYINNIFIAGVHLEPSLWKPNKAAFELIIKFFNCKPNECLLVGDSLEKDIQGAVSVGMNACLVWRDGQKYITKKQNYYVIPDFSYLQLAIDGVEA